MIECPVCHRRDVATYQSGWGGQGGARLLVEHLDRPHHDPAARTCKGSHRPPIGDPPLNVA